MKKANRTALELFHQGTNFQAYEFLGSHRDNGLIYFRVWAPNACKVYLVGDFNGWSESHPLRKISDGGVWECSVDASLIIKKPIYKYKIKNGDKTIYKADPYSIYMQKPLGTASVFYDASSFKWTDKRWLAQRKKIIADGIYSKPMNIYEVHLGSWMRVPEEGDRFRRIVLPCLPYIDYLILNEVEAGACCAMSLRNEQGKILLPEVERAARYLMKNGVGKACVIHFPEGGLGIQDGNPVFVPSFHVPAEEIVSSVGAGDAFCASILYALHEGIPMEQAIRMGNAAAWFNLHNATSTGGAPTLEELNRFLSSHQ